MKIQVLSDEVVDQIAAGEVVERPAHLLKELIENSLDAFADQIEIEITDGGKVMSVVDNGVGMAEEDLALCVNRHATSKIRKSSDLFQLGTFGFRGEALASAAAISRMKISSKTKEQELARRLAIEFGRKEQVVEVGGPVGTKVRIESLFDNVPARKKFLKSDTAEVGQIKQVVKAMGLANPDVQFKLSMNGRVEFFWPPQTALQRAELILQQKLYETELSVGENKVQAYFSAPNDVARSSRQMWFFVQNRWIQDRSLQAAVMDAYRSYLMHGEFPFSVVKVFCDPEEVDVNIHPSKGQVKFVDNRSIFRLVNSAIRDVLLKAPWIQEVTQSRESNGYNNGYQNLSEGVDGSERSSSIPRHESASVSSPPQVNEKFDDSLFEKTQYNQKPSLMEQLKTYAPAKSEPKKDSAAWYRASFREKDEATWAHLQVLGQANLTYIITQSDKGLVLIDQHAAHERVLFERLRAHYERGGFEVQKFLIPLSIDLLEEEVEAVSGEVALFRKLGIEVDQASRSQLLINEAPVILKEESLVTAVSLLARELVDAGGSFAIEKIINDVFATMACHSAIRAGQSLTVIQMRELLEQMDEYHSSFCPHGRPVFIEYDFGELESDFGRRV